MSSSSNAPDRFDVLSSPLEGTNLIEASAGTGKTHTLAGLFLRLVVERRCLVNEILVVTYTEAATAELRDRIRTLLRDSLRFITAGNETDGEAGDSGPVDRALRHLLLGQRADGAVEARLRDAVRSFDEADISTIHGFCRSVLAEHAFESGTAFGVELVEDQSDLELEVSDDFWRTRLPVARHSWLKMRFEASRFRDGPAGLVGLLRQRSLDPARRILPEGDAPDLQPLEQVLRALHDEIGSIWRDQGASAAAILRDLPGWNARTYSPARRELAVEAVERWLVDEDPFDPETLPEVAGLSLERLQGKLKAGYRLPEHELFRACARLDPCYRSLSDGLLLYEHVLERSYLEYAERELESRKRRRGELAFDDLLLWTHRALEGDSGGRLITRLRSRYRAVLVDEFQDTDPLQCRIFLAAFGGEQTVLYLIGDPKQAIYGFRGADIYAYLAAARGVAGRYTLSRNRRSTPELVRAVNALFGGHARPFAHPLIRFEPATVGEGSLSEHLVPPLPSELVLQFRDSSERLTKAEALRFFSDAASDTVVSLVSRGLEPRQIAILVRTNRQAELIQSSLRKRGVSGVVYSAGSVLASEQAGEMERILASLLHPGSESALRSALATSLLGYGAAELEGMQAAELDALLERGRALSDLWRARGFIRAFRSLLDEAGVRERLLVLPDGERRLTNTLHLAELLHRAEGELFLQPEGLLAWLADRRAEETGDEAGELRLETDEGAVTISTIHRSKGLQYDVVLCPFLWDGLKRQRDAAASYHDREGRPILDLAGSDESRARSLEEQIAEGMRLLYVALTRARLLCHVFWGWINEAETSPLFFLLHCRDMADWDEGLGAAMSARGEETTAASMARDLAAISASAAGAIRVCAPMEASASRAQPEPPELREGLRAFGRLAWGSWSVASYTGLTRGRHHDAPERDRDAASGAAGAGAAPGIMGFPRGSAAGSFIHELLEKVDFPSAADADLLPWLIQSLEDWGYPPTWAEVLQVTIRNLARAPLMAADAATRLGSIPAPDRLSELEFHLPVGRSDPRRLAAAFERFPSWSSLGPAVRELAFGEIRGFLQGFIDSVIRDRGRYYILDWKSNYLGAAPQDYAAPQLFAAMRENLYELQYSLYCVALNRFLAGRLRGYLYDEHFGGVFYVFLRGVDPQLPGNGVHFARPPAALVEALENALGGSP